MKPTGKEKVGIGQRSTNESASAAAEFAVDGGFRSPNQSLQRNDHVRHGGCFAPAAPAMIVADL